MISLARIVISILLFSTLARAEKAQPILISKAVLASKAEKNLEHENYLSLAIPFAPVKAVHAELESRLALKLVNRGEAHVTIISPPEFEKLSAKLTMKELNAIAARRKVQESDLDLICVGEGKARVGEREDRTYYLVVRSRALKDLRGEIEKLFRSRGGDARAFVAAEFHPHITVGFTTADLHAHQGVIKSEASCRFDIQLK